MIHMKIISKILKLQIIVLVRYISKIRYIKYYVKTSRPSQ